MARIYKTTDRLPVKIQDITFKISPLSFQQRAEVQAELMEAAKGDMNKAVQASFKAVKYSVKDVSGVDTFDGTPYVLSFESDGTLTDDCVSDLLNLEMFTELSMVAISLVRGVPDKIVDNEGKVVKGISLLYKESKHPNSQTPQK